MKVVNGELTRLGPCSDNGRRSGHVLFAAFTEIGRRDYAAMGSFPGCVGGPDTTVKDSRCILFNGDGGMYMFQFLLPAPAGNDEKTAFSSSEQLADFKFLPITTSITVKDIEAKRRYNILIQQKQPLLDTSLMFVH
ncbi:hypothetical protein POM88_053961 [Heracleum sosnowskyi]|uniref:Uncharacterized protein n=1 Tax=Heracleum sosnowskyi TaxID=360622 RepID=A0AAD8GPG4_9APIA|nr:hypothetical protein POM88_053961 [Heracleum sosnowskyi]